MQNKIAKLQKIKILFVEDEDDILEIISDTLNGLGVEFFVANNGKVGLEIFNNTDIDLIVTDINMPIMNGLDMLSEIKITNKDVICMVMSAHTEQEFKDKAEAIGITEYIIKPFDFIKFLDLIDKNF